ncbi:DUF1996 domain-containing protein [Amycolatopsis sp. K13G38]|uniref:DUF1996 domain-containing protein n=1 Tax=Amycolatopsis acididurans TaxID=2724524 RepID=A0ABX1JDB7_9PSEU|nr:DUF1996 domain-containing protein [Amycolatopsis acididurans]NKQ56859.1 DUF1996 domain-containing protein [Amycolatopsis acididurans]
MSRNEGRHRSGRRTKIATALSGFALALGGIAIATTAGETQDASADAVGKSFFVDITTVQPTVRAPAAGSGASTGTFTVDCGRNENGHFNPDNFIAQPGVRNGAQHLHDYVGNLTTNADSTDESLDAGGTTCKNGDKSTYYWPVLRIDREDARESNAPESPAQNDLDAERAQAAASAQRPRVECPDIASELGDVPDAAMAAVGDELNAIEAAETQADRRLATAANTDEVLTSLRDKRTSGLDRIGSLTGQRQRRDLSGCTVRDRDHGGIDNGAENSDPGAGRRSTTSSAAATSTGSAPTTASPAESASSSATATTASATSTSASQLPGPDENNELSGNDGEIQRPESVSLTFRGSPVTRVRAMPKFLRVLYGDAKPSVNGTTNTKASWTCTGFEDRLIDKYPICPEGSKVERIHDFPSCWDGRNIDSANHRTHIVFPGANGRCARGFVAVPQLRISLVYNVPRDVQLAGQYKVDSFPEESHNPRSDHDDFANVMSQCIMTRVVNCINRGRTCSE